MRRPLLLEVRGQHQARSKKDKLSLSEYEKLMEKTAANRVVAAAKHENTTPSKIFTQPAASARRGAGGFAATRVTVTPRPAGGSAAASAFFSFAPGLRPCKRFFT